MFPGCRCSRHRFSLVSLQLVSLAHTCPSRAGFSLSHSAQGNISRLPIVYLRHHFEPSHPSGPSYSGTPPCYPRGGVKHSTNTTTTRHRTGRHLDLSSALLLSTPLLLDARVRRAGRPHCCATPHHQQHSDTPPHTSRSHGVARPRVAHGRRGCRLPLQGLRRGAPIYT
jgi:hypothetical protein